MPGQTKVLSLPGFECMEYGKAVNMRGLHGVLNMPGYALIIHQYSWVPNKQGVLISGGERGWNIRSNQICWGVGQNKRGWGDWKYQ